MEQKVILFAILNWGLGHASRSVPLIKYFQQKGYKLIICTDGHVVSFLEKEIQDVTFEFLPPYNIKYRYTSMEWNMITQLPKIYEAYRKEHQVFSKLINKYNPIFTISDNRYGCVSSDVPSYFIGHQWNILKSNKMPHRLASAFNQYFIRKFHGYLVPDRKESPISGILTSNVNHSNTEWLGVLSRFSTLAENNNSSLMFQFLAILSGPEPARTNFEKKLINYCESKPDQQFAVVRGTEKEIDVLFPPNCLCFHIVEKQKLQDLVMQSKVIIGRSGYSSVMDYESMGLNNVIYIPTLGQTEQEYLAERQEKQGALYIAEKDLTITSIENAISKTIEQKKNSHKEVCSVYNKVLDKILNEHDV